MKTTKRLLSTLLAIVMLFGVVSIVANAVSIDTTSTNYGYMLTTDAKISKAVSTVKVYNTHDYLNFYINSNYDDMYFFYEIYTDKKMTKLVTGDYTYCAESGSYSWSPLIKLKGVFKTGTFYGATYAARIDDYGNVTVSETSLQTFKFSVTREAKFNQKMVILKSVTNTVNGPTIKWNKLSSDATKYVIYRRSMTGTKWTKVGTVNGSTLSFTDKSIKDKNGKYIYTVKALNKSGTASRYLYNGLSCLFAKAPKISSVATTSDNRIQVKWNNTSNSAYYRVYRSENGGSWKLINSKFKGTTYYDTTAKNGKNYKYTVRAVIPTSNGNAMSWYYNVNKTVDFVTQPTLNPVEVAENGLKITWNKVTGANAYTVYKKTLEKGASWVALSKVSGDVTEFTDTTANAESSFIYTVRSEGRTSRGSYSSKGVEYFTLEQPEFTTTLNEHVLHIEWEPVENAEGYYILSKDGNGNWYVYQNITSGNKCDIYISTTYAEYELTVQAYRGDKTSTYKEDVEKIEYWATATAEYEIYDDIIYFKDGGRYDTTYKLYKKLASEPDSEYELVSTDYSYYLGYPVSLSDKTEVLYDTPYVYQVRMTYNGKEQTENIQTINITKYSPEKYIDGFDVVSKKMSTLTDEISDVEESFLLEFARSKKGTAKDFKESIYIKNGSYWQKTDSNESWVLDEWSYDINNLSFSYVVSDENGSTPVGSVIVNKSNPEYIDSVSPEVNFTSKGLYIEWNDLEGVEKYQVEIYDNSDKSKIVYENTFVDDDSKKYSAFIESAKCLHKSLEFRITAIAKNGNKSEFTCYTITFYNPPVLLEAKSNSVGKIQLKFKGDPMHNDYPYTIFRKAEGETKWKVVGFMWFDDDGSGAYIYEDTNVKSGVKYTYTVRVKNPTIKGYVSYYDTKGVSAVAK